MRYPSSFLAAAAIATAMLPDPAPLAAQTDGTPIRVQTTAKPKKWITGRAVEITADSIGIARTLGPIGKRSNDTLHFARTELHRLQVSRGRKSNAGRGAIGGAVAGLMVGLAAAAGSEGSMVELGGGAVAGSTLGLGVFGALLGALSHREIWEEVSVGAADSAGARGGR